MSFIDKFTGYFKKKKKYSNGDTIDVMDINVTTDEVLPSNMQLVATPKGTASNGVTLWEIGGVMIEAEDKLTAQRKIFKNEKT